MQTLSTIVLDLMRDRDALLAEAAVASASDYVIAFDTGAALFGVQLEIEGSRVTGIHGIGGLRNATRLRRHHAEQLTANGNIHNAAGDIAFPIAYHDALLAQVRKLEQTIAVILDD